MSDARWQLLAYVFVSIVLRMVAAQLWRRRAGIGWVRRLSKGWAASILRFVYYVGLPYAALILGVAPGRYLGLVGQSDWWADKALWADSEPGWTISQLFSWLRDYLSLVLLGWLPDLARLIGLAAVMLLLLGLTWLGYGYFRRRVQAVGIEGWKDAGWEKWRIGRIEAGGRGGSEAGPGKGFSPIQAVYQAVHWGFYRSAIWLLTDDLYLGVWGGILLVGGEWMLALGAADGDGRLHEWEEGLIDASVLMATSVIFFFVPNLWLLLPVHWLLRMTSWRVGHLEFSAFGGGQGEGQFASTVLQPTKARNKR